MRAFIFVDIQFMKFINKTKNTVQLDDINLSISYNDGLPQEIDTQSVKKSFAFQNMISLGGFEVIEASDDRLEKNLFKTSKKYEKPEKVEIKRFDSSANIETIVRGHFYESSGYAKVNRNLVLNLARQGIGVEIDPISMRHNDLNEVEARMLSMFRKPMGKDAILIDSVIPTHCQANSQPYKILYTTAESVEVPRQFIDSANQYDELWVTSSFSKQAYERSGYVGKIYLMPPIINKFLYKEQVAPYEFRPKLSGFVFTSVMTWGYRKGSDALIKAFSRAFSDSDDVSLVLLVAERSKAKREAIKKEINYLTNYKLSTHKILLCHKNVPEYQMPSFYKASNVFVLPSRGEGFGIPFCEASLCGLPVISTRYGGQMDFLNDENSTLVDIDTIERPKDGETGIHYWDNQPFPSLKSDKFIDNLAESMIFARKNYELIKSKNVLLQNAITSRFSGEVVGKTAKSILDIAWKGIKNDSVSKSN